jgi:AcrR family transcriptional regulator
MVFCRRKKNSELPEEKSRELLIQAATRLFAQKGFNGTTVREIACEAGLNVSLVSYYFDGKEGLYRACLGTFGRERLSVMERLLVPPTQGGTEGALWLQSQLQKAITEFVEVQIREPEVYDLIQNEIDSKFPLARDIFAETFLQIFKLWVAFFSEAQRLKILKPEIDPSALVQLIHMTISQLTRTESIRKSFLSQSIFDLEYRVHFIQQVVTIVLSGSMQFQSSTPNQGTSS